MHPNQKLHTGTMLVHDFLQAYRDESRERNYYMQASLIPALATMLPRPSGLESITKDSRYHLVPTGCSTHGLSAQ